MRTEEIISAYQDGKISTVELQAKLNELAQARQTSPDSLSEGEKGLWMLQKMIPGMSAYNVPVAFRIGQKIDIEKFKAAVRITLEQHPMLTAAFKEENGVPYRTVQPGRTPDLRQEDITALPSGQILPYLRKKAKVPFRLDQDPLMRIHLFRRSEQESFLLIVVHHIVFDGSSLLLLLSTLFTAYQDLMRGKPVTSSPAPTGYQDFVRWEREMLTGTEGEAHRAYWTRQLAGPLPVLEIPADHPRSELPGFNGQVYSRTLTPELSEAVKSLAASLSVNASVIFLAVFQVLLYRYTGQDDIIVGMPTLGRPRERFDALVGYFINMVAIRSQGAGGRPCTDFIRDLQLTMVDALDHAVYPFPRLVRELNVPRLLSHSPVFQAVFLYQNFPQASRLQNLLAQYQSALAAEWLDGIYQEGEYELELEVWEREAGFIVHFKYNPDLYEPATVSRMMEHLLNLAGEICSHPGWTADQFCFITAEEQKLLSDWNETGVAYPQDRCIHELFEERARRTPDAVAVIDAAAEPLTYGELDVKSTALAVYLQRQGVGPDCPVGICMERGYEMLIGILGILKAGGAYVPLDPDYPAERLGFICRDSRLKLILTRTGLMTETLPLLEETVQVIDPDHDWAEIAATASGRDILKREVRSVHLAYVIYTSGSTGNPKGVMVSHGNALNTLFFLESKYPVTDADSYLLKTNYTFDVSLAELFGWFIGNGRLVILPPHEEKAPETLAAFITQYRVTHINFVPSMLSVFLNDVAGRKDFLENCPLKYLMVAGEAFPVELVKQAVAVFKDARVENIYGPTEAAIYAAWFSCSGIRIVSPNTPIGKPLANTRLYIVDSGLRPTPVGVPGELCIAGAGVARGYLNQPELSAAKFIANPFGPDVKLYKTGDLARWLPDGNIEYLGRIDHQVKIRGFRIELGEIESRLLGYPEIQNSAVVVREQDQNKQLIAYYTRRRAEPKTPEAASREAQKIKEYLRSQLPEYMIPAFFVPLAAMPLTASGKINRKELTERPVSLHGKAESDIPQSDIEAAVLQIWKEVLNVGDLSTADGFFDGGGDSISAVIAAQRISEQLDCAVNTTTLFKYPNVKALSQYIAALKSVTPVDRPEPGTKDSARSAPIPKLSSPAVDPDYYRESAAIIGISCQFPGARDHREFWRNIRSGQESVRFFSPEELRALGLPDEIIGDPRYVPVQATIEDRDRFDPGFFNISPRDAEFMDPQFRLLLLHSWKAVEDAGYVSGQIPETAVFMSAGNHYDQNDPTAPSRAASRVFGDPDEYVAWILGQGGTIPTMISHKLGFTGPSFFIHSNCSSSLVGLYSAYRTLISGEAQYALVGGAALAPAPKLGYLHQSGLNFSGDGHVKAFDRAADGMVGGEGVAVILLKKAAVAIRDGDHIYALLRGIGVNNDGADKVGFYAPSVKGQAEVIRRVLDRTRVNPESIRYIEAHGTGTKLGDPIELTALSDTYRQYTKRKQFCGLGSVKTNIGHLDTAAGLAGCIKVALSLYHEEIPPSLNYQKPNPEFNLENSPFYVVDRLKVWEETGEPHRAALSSFGIGGTNAHAILERYARPAPEEDGAGQPGNKDVYLIPLSARNDERLQVYARELLDFLNSAARPDLANLAYTLQVGREAMDSRVIFVVNQYDELLDGLEQFIRGENRIAGCFRVAVKASRESGSLLENAEDWQALIQQWLAKGRFTKVAELWVQGLQMDWGLLHQGARLYRISLPTYPFARETYGFAPVAGQGAISADTIAPLHPLVHQNTSDFLEQRFRVTLTGWEFFLADHVLQGQKILPGVVYLEMARAAVILALGTAAPDTAGESGPPAVRLKNIVWVQPVIVNETPVEVNIRLFPEENGEITYEIYSGGSLEPVVHSQGVALLGPDTEAPAWDLEALKARCNRSALPATDFYQAFKAAGFEYGPGLRGLEAVYAGAGQVLARLSLPTLAADHREPYVLHPGMMDSALQAAAGFGTDQDGSPNIGEGMASARLTVPFALEELEIFGECVAAMWALVRPCEARRGKDQEQRTSAANGAMRKLDIDLLDEEGKVRVRMKGYASRALEDGIGPNRSPAASETWLLQPGWGEQSVSREQAIPEYLRHLVIFCEILSDEADWEELQERFATRFKNGRCLIWQPGRAPIAERFTEYAARLLEELQQIQAEKSIGTSLIQLVIPFQGEQRLLGGLSGLLQSARLESSKISGQLIEAGADRTAVALLAMVEENSRCPAVNRIRYHSGKRWVARWSEAEISAQKEYFPWKDRGVYLISGGFGGLGLIFAAEIARRVKEPAIILMGRAAPDARRQGQMRQLEGLGARVRYHQADVADRERVAGLIQSLRTEYGTINGIIHCAGIIRDNFIFKKRPEELRAVLTPKVAGLVNLDQASRELALDCFICFSSVSGSLGGAGQADYAAANAFMDSYAGYRNALVESGQRQGRTISINWPLWQEGGMRPDPETEQMTFQALGMTAMPTAAGIRAFYQSLTLNQAQIMVLHGDKRRMQAAVAEPARATVPEPRDSAAPQALADFSGEALREKAVNYFKNLLAQAIKLPAHQIEADAPLENYGIDSMMVIKLTNQLEKVFGSLPKTLFFEYQNLRDLTGYFIDAYRQQLTGLLGLQPGPVASRPQDQADLSGPLPALLHQGRPARQAAFRRKAGPATDPETTEIAIIGLSGRYPGAENVTEFWKNLRDGKDCIVEVPPDRWNHSLYFDADQNKAGKTYCKWGGFIDGVAFFDPLFFNISPRDAELMDPQERLFLECAFATLEDAGYTRETARRFQGYRLDGNVGVFVGVMYEEYQLYGAQEQLQGRPVVLGGSPASIANRVSYCCNFHGPSIAVDTMCSSSLTAIHLACQSLQRGECGMALAGGVNISVHPNKYLLLAQGKFGSSQGRCESFGRGGDGYVPGEGVGAVLLKPLAGAVADADPIYGVIKATAVNHGGKTNGYSVPNPAAQAEVIGKALAAAGIDCRTIGYVEAHGTGTSLGDPIEIAGLSKAFREDTQAKQFCAIGSVKANIGHCESAAGIAGITKVLLQLKHRQLVPSLHSEVLNPNIDFGASPFVVQRTLEEWRRPVIDGQEFPRRTGVSSFGAGGANAHIVIEEYIPAAGRPDPADAPEPALILLSARNEERLREQALRLLAALDEPLFDDYRLADIAYTLQMGREAMEERLAFGALSVAELKERLRNFLSGTDDPAGLYRGQVKTSRDTVAVFAADAEFQEAAAQIIARGKYGKMMELWVKGWTFDWNKLYGARQPRRISLPTYPFARERYWEPDTKPELSGVSRTAALTAAMLHPLAHQNTSDFSVQRFTSTFTGEEFFLAHHLVQGQRVLPGVAYLEMARAALALAADGLTGEAEEKEAAGIRLRHIIWVRPLVVGVEPVRVHIGLYPEADRTVTFEVYSETPGTEREQAIHCQGSAVFLTGGKVPALDIGTLQARCTKGRLAAAECYDRFAALGFEYGPEHRGIERIDLGRGEALAKLCLPSLAAATGAPYVLHPGMIDAATQAAIGLLAGAGGPDGPGERAALPFALDDLEIFGGCSPVMWSWVRYSNDPAEQSAGSERENVNGRLLKLDIDLCDEQGKVCVRMKGFSARAVAGTPDTAGARPASATLLLSPEWREQPEPAGMRENAVAVKYARYLVILCEVEENVRQNQETGPDGADFLILVRQETEIAKRFQSYAVRVLEALRTLLQDKTPGQVLVQLVTCGEGDSQLGKGLFGLLRTAGLENPKMISQLIMVESGEDGRAIAAKLLQNSKYPVTQTIRYQNGQRYVAVWNEVEPSRQEAAIPWKDGGIYLISGGAGGLGMIFAREIAIQAKAPILILAGRSPLGQAKEAELEQLGKTGARIVYRQVDVADPQAVAGLFREIRESFGNPQGVIHSAGIIKDNFILKKTREELAAVLAPKVAGVVNLDQAGRDLPLDFFICFSSGTGVAGNVGQADYAAANAFMDAYAAYRNRLVESEERSGRTLSLNWPLWEEGGMHVDAATEQQLRSMGGTALTTPEGIRAFYQSWATGHDQVMVVAGDPLQIRRNWLSTRPGPETAGLASSAGEAVPRLTENIAVPAVGTDQLREKTAHYLKRLLSATLKLPAERIEADAPLEKYGIDSVAVMQMTNQLERQFGSLAKTLFFEYQDLQSLAAYFADSHRERLLTVLGVADQANQSVVPASPPAGETGHPAFERRVRSRFAHLSFPNREATGAADIAVIGVAGRYPQAGNLSELWNNLREGRDCITEIPAERWNHGLYYDPVKNRPGKTYCKWGGFIDGVDRFDPLFFNISPREAAIMDPQERLFLECAFATLEDAAYTREALNRPRSRDFDSNVGVFVGVMYEEYPYYGVEEQVQGRPVALAGNPASIANRVSYFCNFHGPSMAVDTMCSSSLTAIHLACLYLQNSQCGLAIAGGVNVSIHPNKYLMLAQGNFVSSTGRCESFGAGGDGYVPGEGVGAVLLKPLSQAIADGDHIYGVIKATAINHGGKTNGYSVPNPNAQAGVIGRTLKEAGIDPRTIGYVEAHGTGTSLGDPIEIGGLAKSFGEYTSDRQFCSIGSIKSNIGHLEAAAGIAALTKVLLQLKHCQLVPSLHSQNLNANIDFEKTPFFVQQELTEWKRPFRNGKEFPRRAGVSAFGAGGSNAHIVIEEYIPDSQAAPRFRPVFQAPAFIVLSAQNEERLRERAQQLLAALREQPYSGFNLYDIAYTLQVGREAMEERFGCCVRSLKELEEKLTALLEGQSEGADCYRGRVKGNRETLALLAGDEDLEPAIAAWIAKRKYGKLLDLWVKGLGFDWNRLYGEEQPRRISLPTYPFARERYWAPRPDDAASAPGNSGPPADRSLKRRESFLHKRWEPCWASSRPYSERGVVIVANAATKKLAGLLSRYFPQSRIVDRQDLQSQSGASEAVWRDCGGWVDLTGCGRRTDESMEWLTRLQHLIEQGPEQQLMILGVTRGLESWRNRRANLAGAERVGLYRMLQSEYKYLRSRHMDADPALNPRELARQIAAEFGMDGEEAEVCYRDGIRYRALLKEFPAGNPGGGSIIFPESQVLWITGGTRGLGYLCAQHFVKHYGVKRLVLTGREAIPPRPRWEALSSQETALAQKIRSFRELEKQGVQVKVLAVDLTDRQAVGESVREIKKTMGPVGGLIHCAGISDPENPAFIRKSVKGIQKVLDPKISGVERLYEALRHEPLQFMVLFSSVAAVVPTLAAAESDYAMANAYLDYFAEAHRKRCPIVSIQWPSWSETGMGAVNSSAYQQTGLLQLSDEEGLRLLDQVLAGQMGPVVLAALVNPDQWRPQQLMRRALTETIPSHPGRVHPAATPVTSIVQAAPATELSGNLTPKIRTWLTELFAAELKIDPARLEMETPFADYGADSILLAQVMAKINQAVSGTLDPSVLYEYPTINSLAARLAGDHGDALGFSGPEQPAGQPPQSLAASVPMLAPSRRLRRAMLTRPISSANSAPEIAVVGISCRFPGADNPEEYWRLIAEGHSAIRTVPQDRWGDPGEDGQKQFYAGLLQPLTHFDARFFLIPETDLRVMDPQALLILEESLKLWYHAGYSHREMKGKAVGVYLGGRSQHRPIESGLLQARNPIVAVGQNYLAANVSQFFDLHGPSLVLDTACSSALVGMNLAVQALRNDEIECALVGGVNLLNSASTHRIFQQRGILSPEPAFHIFDRRARGIVLGEGVGVVLLKTVDRALQDGDTVYAVIKGIAVNNDGRTAGPATPNLQAQQEVLRTALARSRKKCEAITYIEANGSGSEVTDLLELKALQGVYRASNITPCCLGSVKPNIGHTLCAEGIAAFIKVVLMLHHRKLPPFLSGEQPPTHFDLKASPFYFNRKLSDWDNPVRTAALNCCADGGTNAHLILESWEQPAGLEIKRRPLPPPQLDPQAKLNTGLSCAPERIHKYEALQADPGSNEMIWKTLGKGAQ